MGGVAGAVLPEEEPTREQREKKGAKLGGFLIDSDNFPS